MIKTPAHTMDAMTANKNASQVIIQIMSPIVSSNCIIIVLQFA